MEAYYAAIISLDGWTLEIGWKVEKRKFSLKLIDPIFFMGVDRSCLNQLILKSGIVFIMYFQRGQLLLTSRGVDIVQLQYLICQNLFGPSIGNDMMHVVNKDIIIGFELQQLGS